MSHAALARQLDPIAAIATAPGRGAVGIVRISGAGLQPLMRALLRREPAPRQALYGPFLDAQGQAIDQGLALYFPAPHSYTGEDVLELQAHGGPVVLQLLLARCLEAAAEMSDTPHTDGPPGSQGGEAFPVAPGQRLPRLRLAEPGEFTQRAFLNDKLDLAQAEAVADLIDASTEAAARSAVRSLGGAFSKEIGALRDALIQLRMLVEATLDFPEEEIDFLEQADARGRLRRLAVQLENVLARARQGALLRDGLRVVIAGQPNAGKSSLLNALAGAELAIVTPIAGTTRDRINETIQIEGVPVHVIDTAGLRDAAQASDEVERIGIARSWEAIGDADAVLLLHDLTRWADPAYRQADADIAARLPTRAHVIHLFNKADSERAAGPEQHRAGEVISTVASSAENVRENASANASTNVSSPALLRLSARTGEGLEALRREILRLAGWRSAPDGVFIARARHLEALRTAQAHLAAASALAEQADTALDLLAEELRLGHDALGAIVGQFSADDLLGEIFSRFCIGK